MEVEQLLTHSAVMKYIKAVEGQGIGCSGVLDAHMLSLKFFRLKAVRLLSFQVDIRNSYKKKKKRLRDTALKQRH